MELTRGWRAERYMEEQRSAISLASLEQRQVMTRGERGEDSTVVLSSLHRLDVENADTLA
jgi:hypothetical protein